MRGPATGALLALMLAAPSAGCAVGPDFHPPTTISPPGWGGEPRGLPGSLVAGPADLRWWGSFHDPELASLVGRLLRQNIDLQMAAERIRQADAQRDVTRAAGLPQIDEKAAYSHERQSSAGFISLVQPRQYAPFTYDIWQTPLTASWELDLFGRVRRAVEADRANIAAVTEARHAVALDAVANLAADYLQLRGTEAREAVATSNLALAQQDLALVQSQFRNGTATTLAVAQARAELASVAATLPPLHDAEARLVNAAGFLLAEPPRALAAELAPHVGALPPLPPLVPVGLPSDLLRRRPDIREAEAKLHQATAQTGVAVAAFYPDVSLTGQFGGQGRAVGNAISLPDRFFQVGPAIDLPLFEGGRLAGTLRLRRSAQREAALDWRNTVLQAWQDVDNAMTAYADDQSARTHVADAVAQDRVALVAARQSYAAGAVDFLDVVAEQRALLQAQDQLVSSDTSIETDLVGLYKALGGGWDAADSDG